MDCVVGWSEHSTKKAVRREGFLFSRCAVHIPKPSYPVSTTLEILFLLFYEVKSNPISDTDHPIVDNERWIFKLDIFRCSCKIVGKRSHINRIDICIISAINKNVLMYRETNVKGNLDL